MSASARAAEGSRSFRTSLGHRVAPPVAGAAEPVAHRALFAERLGAAARAPVATLVVGGLPFASAGAVFDGHVVRAGPHLGGREQSPERVRALLVAVGAVRHGVLRGEPEHDRVRERREGERTPDSGRTPPSARERFGHVGGRREPEVAAGQLRRISGAEHDRDRPLEELEPAARASHCGHRALRCHGGRRARGEPREDHPGGEGRRAGDGRERVGVRAYGRGAVAV